MASKPAEQVANGAAAIVAALLLPPLGVYLTGGLGRSFWLTAVLTCIGYVPGILFALVMVLRPRSVEHRVAG